MGNNKIVKTAAAVALGASVLATSVAPGAASAATTYKLKSGKLVNAKTGKAVKGYKVYKSKLYNNGKKVKGYKTYSKKLYKDGSLFSGSYKKVYYVAGVKDKTKPVIKVKAATKSVKYGATAPTTASLVKSVTDNSKLKITAKATITFGGKKVTKIDTKKPGKYTVTFNATDKAGNKAKAVKVVVTVGKKPVVVTPVDPTPADTINPVITVGEFASTVEFGAENVVIPTATATDNSGETPAVTSVITFNGETVEKIDTTKSGVYTITFTAKDTANNTETKTVTITVAAEKVAVEAVSAINNKTFEFTVTYSGNVQDVKDAKDATLKLGNTTVVAKATKVNGKVVTYTIATADQSKLVTGNYSVTIDGFDFTGSANYEKLVTETSIAGVVVLDNGDGVTTSALSLEDNNISGVTVKTDNQTATSNGFGYFNLTDVTPGEKEVVFTKEGYFTARTTVDTKRTNVTSQVVELTKRVKAKYAIEGTILNAADSQPIANDTTVTLQRLVDGKWTDVKDTAGVAYTATTTAGKYAFANDPSQSILSATDVEGALDYATDGSIKYRVVANKAVSSTNFTNVYDNQVSDEFTLSDEKATTTPKVFKATKVKEVTKIDLSVVWNELAKTNATAKTDLTLSLIGTNGEEVLVAATTLSNVKEASKDGLKDGSIDLVEKALFKESAAVNPRLSKGTYFLKVDDTQNENAVAYIPVQVTEEGKVSALSATITEAANLTPSVTVPATKYNAVYNLTNGTNNVTGNALKTASDTDFNTNNDITSDVKTYLQIGGTKVVVGKELAQGYNYDATTKVVSTSTSKIDRLPAGAYTVATTNGEFVTNVESTSVNLTQGGSVNKAVEVSGLSGITAAAVKKSDNAISVASNDIAKVELVSVATGKVVDTNNATYDAAGAITTGASLNFKNVTPGEYKLNVEAVGYENGTSDKFTVYDFQETTAPKVELKEGASFVAPVVKGIALFTDDNSAVAGATISAYDKDGKLVGTESVNADGSYDFGTNLTKGETYTLVLRDDSVAETKVETITVPTESKAIKTVDFNVVKGGKAKYEVIIVDENNNALDLTAFNAGTGYGTKVPVMYLKDENAGTDYSTQLTSIQAGSTAPATAAQIAEAKKQAEYALVTGTDIDDDGFTPLATQSGTNVTANVFETATALSAGAYTLVVQEGTKTKEYTATVSIQKGATVDGGIVKVQLKSTATGTLSYNVSGTVTGAVSSATATDGYVVAIDTKTNQVVSASSITAAGAYTLTALPNNVEYKIVTVINGKFVSSKNVTVQDRNVSGVDLTVTAASR